MKKFQERTNFWAEEFRWYVISYFITVFSLHFFLVLSGKALTQQPSGL